MLNDTGFFCRNVLGMDTDKGATGGPESEPGKGGVRADGPHQETIAFMDDESHRYRVLWTPRFTYKSSKVTGYILRNILKYPNIAILLAMHTTKEAENRVRVIRDILTENEVIKELFPNIKGPEWGEGKFITSLRTDTTLLTPTLYAASPQKGTAGGRPDLIVFDDIVNETNSVTDVQLERGRRFMESTLALRGHNTRYLSVATPWHEADANHWAIDAGWHKLTHLDVGCDVHVNEKGIVELSGTARWPHLPMETLRSYLRNPEKKDSAGMSFEFFMSQFKLQVVKGLKSQFQRTHFQPASWQDHKHRDLTGYLLTDTAPSGSASGDMNVLLYVGIDADDRHFILDLECGYWTMYEFAERYLNLVQRWAGKVNHRMELWEKGHNYHSYGQHIRVQAKARNIRVHLHAEQRNQSVAGKDVRIGSAAIIFQSRQLYVMDTVPRTWSTGTEIRELWNPAGHEDGSGMPLPSGDLVQQFIRFPVHTKKDIPDAFALVRSIDTETKRLVCCHVKSSRQVAVSTERQPVRQSGTRFHGSTSSFYQRISRGQSASKLRRLGG
jgi:hypothetical protein